MDSQLGISSEELPARLRKPLDDTLRPNEQLLWVDVPIARDIAVKTIPIAAVGLVGVGCLAFVELPSTIPIALAWLAGVIALSWPLVSSLHAKQTAYAISSSRLLVVDMWAWNTVRSISPDKPLWLSILLWDGGSGTLRFFDETGSSGGDASPHPILVFKSVKNAWQVANLVQSLRELPLPTSS